MIKENSSLKNFILPLLAAIFCGCAKQENPDARLAILEAKIAKMESETAQFRTNIALLNDAVVADLKFKTSIWNTVTSRTEDGTRHPAAQRPVFEVSPVTFSIIEKNKQWWRYAFKCTIQCNSTNPTPFRGKVHWLNSSGYKVDDFVLRLEFAPGETKIVTDNDLIVTTVAPTVQSAVVKIE